MSRNIETTLKAAIGLASQVKGTQEKHNRLRKESRRNFNLFEGIITRDKLHQEKYHSNFLGYLLNPVGSHDCGAFFLKAFLKILKQVADDNEIQYNYPPDHEIDRSVVTRERYANGRPIDITIEFRRDWVIFIENKIRSDERNEQMQDYYEFSRGFNKPAYNSPVFLTRDGRSPTSIKGDHKKNIICLSYQDHIVPWLETCCSDQELIHFPHIIRALLEYIYVINQELKIMDNEGTEEIMNYLDRHKGDAVLLIEQIEACKNVIATFSNKVRKNFFSKLKDKLIQSFSEIGISVVGQRESDEYFAISCKYQQTAFTFRLYFSKIDSAYGAGWQIFFDNEPYNFAFDSNNYGDDDRGKSGYGIFIKEINDHENINAGTRKIISVIEDHNEPSVIKGILDSIIIRLKETFIPSLLLKEQAEDLKNQVRDLAKGCGFKVEFFPADENWGYNYWHSCFYFYRDDWRFAIGFGFEKPNWHGFYYGVCSIKDLPPISKDLRKSIQNTMGNEGFNCGNWAWYQYYENGTIDSGQRIKDLSLIQEVKQKVEALMQRLEGV